MGSVPYLTLGLTCCVMSVIVRGMLLFFLLPFVTAESGIGVLVAGYGNSGQLSSVELLGDSFSSSLCKIPDLSSPLKRHLAIHTMDDQVLVCGGKGLAGQYFTSCLTLDPQIQTWRLHSNMLKNREYSSAVSLDSGDYVLGGSGSARYTTEFLATGSTSWELGPEVPGAGMEDGCGIALEEKFLAIGGYWETKQVVEYDLFSGSWIQWPELPYGRYGHKCARLGDTVVIAGGADERGDYVPSTMVVDLVTKQVTTGGDVSTPRFEHGVARLGEEILAFGGFDASYDCLTEVDVWNPETQTWKPAGYELENGRAEFATVVVPEDSAVCSGT